MIVLSCNNISKSFVVDKILDNISFSIKKGEKVGVVGLNGSGKSTLFNILYGKVPKDTGEIYIRKGLKIGYLKQHTQINSEKTVFDECLEVFNPLIEMEKRLRKLEKQISIEGKKGESHELETVMTEYSSLLEKFTDLNGYGFKSEIKGVLKGLGFSDKEIYKEVNVLSGGQKSRLQLAILLLQKPDLLLLDEPTNHLDIEAINWLEKFLIEYKGAALIISHDRYFLDSAVSKIFHLENTHLNTYNTNYTDFMKLRKKELELLKKQYENQQKEIKRQEEIIERFSNYGDRRYIKQAQSRQKMLDKMKTFNKPINTKKVNLTFEPNIKSGQDVLTVENISKSFNDFKLFEDINFNIYKGEKVGLIGKNGVGKTTLFKMILRKLKPSEGEIILGHNVNTGYFDQEQSNLDLNSTVVDLIWETNPDLNHYEIRTYLSKFLFIGDDIFKEVSELSGGERGRLSLLKLMLSNANFLLMDEPTNHLDIDSKEVLEEALQTYEGTVLIISHDRYFLNKVSNKIIEMSEDGITEYLGNYDYYIAKKNEVIEEEEETEITKTQLKSKRKKERVKREKIRKKKKEIESLETHISEKEELVKELNNILCNPNVYEQPEKIKELVKKRENTQKDLSNLYNKWITLIENP
ncbi:MAG TPA: ABC-F family ATP-binding cassette domain-containing protein [Tissierellales bacterium]|nr:ABC-F family ATP-binding cassette domain-containing protein [Tissierellales bacterium]